tara:strand:+ start:699 stop:902 length:204 start_codon:yes stop_codon:yes gene_type:complete
LDLSTNDLQRIQDAAAKLGVVVAGPLHKKLDMLYAATVKLMIVVIRCLISRLYSQTQQTKLADEAGK